MVVLLRAEHEANAARWVGGHVGLVVAHHREDFLALFVQANNPFTIIVHGLCDLGIIITIPSNMSKLNLYYTINIT